MTKPTTDDDSEALYSPEEQAILRLIHTMVDGGPVTVADVVEAARTAGHGDPPATEDPNEPHTLGQLINYLLIGEEDLWLDDGRIARIVDILDGTVFTHRLTAAELATGVLEFEVDLCVADFGLEPEAASSNAPSSESGDRIVVERNDETYGLRLAPSMLAGLGEGSLIGLRRRGHTIELELIDNPGPATAERDAILAQLQPILDNDEGDDPTIHVMNSLLADPSLFTHPGPPLSELLIDAGLTIVGSNVGPGDRIWSHVGLEQYLANRAASSYELDDCCFDALRVVNKRWRARILGLLDHPDAPSVPATIEGLGHGDAGPAFADVTDTPEQGADLRSFAQELLDAASDRDIGPRVLVAYLAEQDGDLHRAEELYRQVLALQPQCPAAIEGIAQMDYDRSDFPSAARLLRQIYEPTDSHVGVTDHLARHLLTASRNDRCPCGSGRKYKACHDGRILTDPASRADLVLAKLANFAVSRPRRTHLATFSWRNDVDPDTLLSSRFLFDSFLLDGVNVEAYRRLRGVLLPADEATVLDGLVDSPLLLAELVEVASPTILVLRSVIDEERLVCELPHPYPELTPGTVGLLRLHDGRLVGQFTIIEAADRSAVTDLLADGQPSLAELFAWFADHSPDY